MPGSPCPSSLSPAACSSGADSEAWAAGSSASAWAASVSASAIWSECPPAAPLSPGAQALSIKSKPIRAAGRSQLLIVDIGTPCCLLRSPAQQPVDAGQQDGGWDGLLEEPLARHPIRVDITR